MTVSKTLYDTRHSFRATAEPSTKSLGAAEITQRQASTATGPGTETLHALSMRLEASPTAVAQRQRTAALNQIPRVAALRSLSEGLNPGRHVLTADAPGVPVQAQAATSPMQLVPRQSRNAIQQSAPLLSQRKLGKITQRNAHLISQDDELVRGGKGQDIMQGKIDHDMHDEKPPAQRMSVASGGLPTRLRQGIEGLSGLDMGHVRVHYNSPQPARMQAHAYAQGRDIHLAPGAERHLPHEAWHMVQQRQGRVRPTGHLGPHPLNDDRALEREADRKGAEAARLALNPLNTLATSSGNTHNQSVQRMPLPHSSSANPPIIQLQTSIAHISQEYYVPETKEIVGKEMHAELDPAEPKKGSATSANSSTQKGLMKAIEKIYPNANAKKGHLLNHDLGGHAIAANLFPITGQANALHSNNVEEPIKQALYNGYGVEYKVDAKFDNPLPPNTLPHKSSFDINVDFIDPSNPRAPMPTQHTKVESDLSDGSGSINGLKITLPTHTALRLPSTPLLLGPQLSLATAQVADDLAKAAQSAADNLKNTKNVTNTNKVTPKKIKRNATISPADKKKIENLENEAKFARKFAQESRTNQLTLAKLKKAEERWKAKAPWNSFIAQVKNRAKSAAQSAEQWVAHWTGNKSAWAHYKTATKVEEDALGPKLTPSDIDETHEQAQAQGTPTFLPQGSGPYIKLQHS
ncbi:MAG TPA: DUF4157 domain-containing protein [Dongiaceae bacterium]|jgi:hypothetical protein|nr:DUF4157 domain-containing protein [Dongiaceae bacterium]